MFLRITTRALTRLGMGLALSLPVVVAFAQSAGDTPQIRRPPAPAITTKMLDLLPALPGELSPLQAASAADPAEQEKIALGELLFFDTRLSVDRSLSCASCHDPAKAYGDGRTLSVGFGGKQLGRHAPTLLNAAYNKFQFWDGRANGLEEQAKGPIMAAAEMNMTSEQELVSRLSRSTEYQQRFLAAFSSAPSLNNVAKAIAAFERTLVTPDSRFDAYLRGDKSALNEQAKRGLIMFIGKASCSECHNGMNLTDDKFHVLGGAPGAKEDPGRYAITKDDKDRNAFKTPTLRNIELTAPYMHDGSMKTLEEVVDFYDKGCGQAANKSELIFKLELTRQEKADLIAFLKALTGTQPIIEPPQLPSDN